MNRLSNYIDGVISGDIVVGKLTRLAVERHLSDLKKDWDYYFDEAQAGKAVKFAEICCHWKGNLAGQRIKLEPFQVFRRSMLFGWRHKNGGRRFRTSYYEVARKNAKTTEAAIDTLFHLISEEKFGGQVFAGATKEAQARILVNDVGRIAQKTPELKKYFNCFFYKDMITRVVMPSKGSFVSPLGRDSKSEDGLDPSMGVIDEYHAHQTDEILNVIESGQGARTNPLINIITTAGFNMESPCYRLRKVAIDLLTGKVVNDRFLAVIFCMDEEDDWEDPRNWIKSNPCLGASVNLDYLESRFQQAQIEGGEKKVDFITKNLNAWLDAPTVWIEDKKWMANHVEEEIPEGATAYGGLDLAKWVDINCFSLFFPDYSYMKLHTWVPEGKLAQQKEADYRRWADEGWLSVTPGDVVDHSFVLEDVKRLCERYNVEAIAFDRYIAFHTIIKDLVDTNVTMLEHGQGFRDMSTPTLRFEEMVLKKELRHDGNPVMRWMVSNVVIDRDAAGNTKPTKGKSSGKIDGVVSGIMALGAWSRPDVNGVSSYYDGGSKGAKGSYYDTINEMINE